MQVPWVWRLMLTFLIVMVVHLLPEGDAGGVQPGVVPAQKPAPYRVGVAVGQVGQGRRHGVEVGQGEGGVVPSGGVGVPQIATGGGGRGAGEVVQADRDVLDLVAAYMVVEVGERVAGEDLAQQDELVGGEALQHGVDEDAAHVRQVGECAVEGFEVAHAVVGFAAERGGVLQEGFGVAGLVGGGEGEAEA